MLDRPISPSRRAYIGVMGLLCALSVLLVCALALFLIGYVLAAGLPNLSWELLTTKPSYLSDTIGILPDILNTIYIILAALLIVLPLGAGAAVYLTEYAANKRLVSVIEYAAETLSGIPSIIYGLVGMLVFTGVLGTSLLAGALTLVIMNLPTIMRTTQESLRTVPQSYREGAFGLGAGKWRVIRTVVLPGCADGIITGCILSVGRILGESAALLFTAGFAHALNGFFTGLASPGATLTVALYVYAKEQGMTKKIFRSILLAAVSVLLASLVIIIERISGKQIVAPRAKAAVKSKPNLLIDIQTKMQQVNSPGFERWAKIFNLKEMARTVIYLQENGLTDLGELERACDAAVQKFNDLGDQMKAAERRMKDISELQRQIGTYGKTQEIYAQYRKLTDRKKEKFYEQHSSEITACQAAKRYFNSLGLKKLPSMQSLKQEYAMLQAENKKRYPEYKQAREKMIELLTAKNNVERILGVTEKEKNRSRQQEPR